MSDNSAFGFGKFVPGFDFLQNLAKSAQPAAAQGVPGLSNWVAPTLSVEEIDKRIQELKTVQFWLEQNGTALKATIQALEVQKMTLNTLQGMNINMGEMAKAFSASMPPGFAASPSGAAASSHTASAAPTSAAPTSADTPSPAPHSGPGSTESAASSKPSGKSKKSSKSSTNPNTPAIDPLQWWGSLTQQFQNIASAALQDSAAQALKAAPNPGASATPAAQSKTPQNSKKPQNPARKTAPVPSHSKKTSTRGQ